jgi:hypothetical protein
MNEATTTMTRAGLAGLPINDPLDYRQSLRLLLAHQYRSIDHQTPLQTSKGTFLTGAQGALLLWAHRFDKKLSSLIESKHLVLREVICGTLI